MGFHERPRAVPARLDSRLVDPDEPSHSPSKTEDTSGGAATDEAGDARPRKRWVAMAAPGGVPPPRSAPRPAFRPRHRRQTPRPIDQQVEGCRASRSRRDAFRRGLRLRSAATSRGECPPCSGPRASFRSLTSLPRCSERDPRRAPDRPESRSADPHPRSLALYPSPSVGSEPKWRSNSSALIGDVPVRLRISSMEVAFEGQSGAKISFASAASSSVIWSIWA